LNDLQRVKCSARIDRFERKVSLSSFFKKSECFVKQKLVPARANPRYIVLQIQQKIVVTQTETMLSVWDIDHSDQPASL
jgi:hypothetical protein